MNARLVALYTILLAFGVYTTRVLLETGYLGLLDAATANLATGQVLIDLVIVCVLVCTWMLGDARARGARAWPFVAITVVAGSFGPLLYLILREHRKRAGQGEVDPVRAAVA